MKWSNNFLLVLTVVTLNVLLSSCQHKHRVMGPIKDCDNGKDYLEVDWDPNKDTYLYKCEGEQNLPLTKNSSILETDIPEQTPWHKCMDTSLDYKKLYGTVIPTSGMHRPVWPVYGEYKFLPPQRWLHGQEHGAVTALYHPCVKTELINEFRKLVTGCLRKHLFTPYGNLSKDHPFALVTWKARLQMSTLNKQEIINFIRSHALHAPEDTPKDGLYNFGLIKKSDLVSDEIDSQLCPKM
jgi:hypothetical protein